MNERRITALLGRRDEPTDAIEDYCRYLAAALREHAIEMDLMRVPWAELSWTLALRKLRQQARDWRGRWVLVQYTALSWSKRGFPRRFLRVLNVLRSSGARIAIVFHDVEPYPGTRLIDKVRRLTQLNTMRGALRHADLAIFTVSLDHISWLPGSLGKVAFIPVGPNLPIPPPKNPPNTSMVHLPTVAVFGITGGQAGTRETQAILSVTRHAAQHAGAFRLRVFGRYADVREPALREGLQGLGIDFSVEGVLEDQEVVKRLRASDVLLFVRGGISSRRGSAIAAIACGVPVVAYAGPETAPPITQAGVLLVPPGDPSALQNALVRVLADSEFRAGLARAAQSAYNAHFSWKAIASRFAEVLSAQ